MRHRPSLFFKTERTRVDVTVRAVERCMSAEHRPNRRRGGHEDGWGFAFSAVESATAGGLEVSKRPLPSLSECGASPIFPGLGGAHCDARGGSFPV